MEFSGPRSGLLSSHPVPLKDVINGSVYKGFHCKSSLKSKCSWDVRNNTHIKMDRFVAKKIHIFVVYMFLRFSE